MNQMNKVPKVSIILPCMNLLQFTRQAVEGIALTCDVSFELIVINNASKDETKDYLDNLAEGTLKKNPNFVRLIVCHNTVNRYLSGAINQGCLLSSAPYISVIANDILVPPNMYSFFIKKLEEDKSIGATGPWYTEDPRFTNINSFYNNYDKVPKSDEWTTDWHFSVCYVMPREVYEKVGEWDENFKSCNQDNDWGFRLKGAGYKATSWKGSVCAHVFGSYGRGQIGNEKKVASKDSRWFKAKWGVLTDKRLEDATESSQKLAYQGNYIGRRQKKNLIKYKERELNPAGTSLF